MMAACYIDEEEVWKCPKHPSKRRRNGICPTCLRDRLVILCPDCAKLRPCPCVSATSSSSSSSSSFSFLNGRGNGGGSVSNRLSNLVDGEPSFRRSRSLAIPFLRSKNSPDSDDRIKTPSFWSVLKRSKTKRRETTKENEGVIHNNHNDENVESNNKIDDFARMMMRSRSVGVGTKMTSTFGRDDVRSTASVKGKSWYFLTPMKVFRSTKTPKVINNARSPLHRG